MPTATSIVFTGSCAVIVGLVAGYSFGIMSAPPLAVGLLALSALILGAGAIAFNRNLTTTTEAGSRQREDGQEALRQELDRSRRFERWFVLMRIPMVTGRSAPESGPTQQPDAETLAMMLRSIDRTWSTRGATYVLLPESTRADAQRLAQRLSGALPETFNAGLVEYAEFPNDGVTTGALLANLRRHTDADEVAPVRLVPRPRSDASAKPHRQDRRG